MYCLLNANHDLYFSISIKAKECKKMILVAMHHTFDKDYTLPSHREQSYDGVILLVDCLFFENKGLLSCPRNKKAVKTVRKEVITSFVVLLWYMLNIAIQHLLQTKHLINYTDFKGIFILLCQV